MTDKEVFAYSLIELNKVEAPSLLLEDYNYLINKAIYEYMNMRYNLYNTSQQTTDDLQVLTGGITYTLVNYTPSQASLKATISGTVPVYKNGGISEMAAKDYFTYKKNTYPITISESDIYGGKVALTITTTTENYAKILADFTGTTGKIIKVASYANLSGYYRVTVAPVGISATSVTLETNVGYLLDATGVATVISSAGNSITAITDYDATIPNTVKITSASAHNLSPIGINPDGKVIFPEVTIDNTDSYNGTYTIQSIISSTEFVIYKVYIAGEVFDSTLSLSPFWFRSAQSEPEIPGEATLIAISKTKAGFAFPLPNNYYHLLNCVVTYKLSRDYKCYPKGRKEDFGVKRLTADMYQYILQNIYMKPEYKRPYYYIIDRIGSTAPDLELRAGNLGDVFYLDSVHIDYLRTPTKVNLTTEVFNDPGNPGTPLEFPDYVCQEIVKVLVKLILENSSDQQRLGTFIPVNQSIPGGLPGQQQK